MATSSLIREKDFLQTLIPSYEAEGFSVFLHPAREMLPPFMRGYQPDAIAIREDKKIAIEIKREGNSPVVAAMDELQKIFSNDSDWELRVYYIPGRLEEEDIQPSGLPEIDAALAEVEQLKRAGHLRAALIMAWAALEAAGRALLPQNLVRPQEANKLVELLASEGVVTPTEADSLRRAITARNAATHGQLAVPITQREVDQVIAAASLVRGLATESGPS